MRKSAKKNLNFNYPKTEDNGEDFIRLFNCYKCGFHSKAISKIYIKGYEDDFIIQLLSFHPEKPVEKIDIEPRKLKNDGILIKDISCGICGKPGKIESIPKDILEAFGFSVNKSNDNSENPVSDKQQLIQKKSNE